MHAGEGLSHPARLVLIHGPAAAGKLTIARLLAARSGLALFHNHLVVDAVLALFPFGSPPFVALRDRLWLEAITAAIAARRSLIFTFAPEPSVPADFIARLGAAVAAAGGQVQAARLTIEPAEQERRLVDPARAAFGKLASVDLLRTLRAACDACAAAMPPADIAVDTTSMTPEDAACRIAAALGLAPAAG